MFLLYIAAENDHVEVIKELLHGLSDQERKAYLHIANNNGVTPLNIALKKGHSQFVRVLKEYAAQESWGNWCIRKLGI